MLAYHGAPFKITTVLLLLARKMCRATDGDRKQKLWLIHMLNVAYSRQKLSAEHKLSCFAQRLMGMFKLLLSRACVHAQAELGFGEHHQNEVINFMRFARSKRILRLKTIDSCFEDLKESR